MLFRKKIPKSCRYCLHGTALDEDTVLCCKRGVTESCGACRKFRYDPCKRIPPKPKALNFSEYDTRDYSL